MTPFGLEADALADLRALCERSPGLERVWIFGSRARDDWRPRSDIDLALDAPTWTWEEFGAFKDAVRALPLVYKLDLVHWQTLTTPVFKEQIERDRKVFWEPRRRHWGEATSSSHCAICCIRSSRVMFPHTGRC